MQVFNNNMDRDTIVLLAARASRIENQDAIDEAIVNMLADPKEVGIYIRHLTYMYKTESTTLSLHACAYKNTTERIFSSLGSCKHHRSAFSSVQSSGQTYCNYIH